MSARVLLGDTTLRDGEQVPGLCFSHDVKVEIARALVRAGVARIDVGVPVAGEDETQVFSLVRSACPEARLSAWGRATLRDVRASMACEPDEVRVTTPSSLGQIRNKLHTSERGMLARLLPCVRLASEAGFAVCVGLEDASRARPDFLVHIAREVARAGATSVQVADTVGVFTPSSAEALVARVREEGGLPVSFHGHNDFGMALACACGAVRGGAFLVEGTLLGIGERAGNVDVRKFAELMGPRAADVDVAALVDAERLVARVAEGPWTQGIPNPEA